MKMLHGVTTAMVTPMNREEKVDLEAIRAEVEFLVARGVHCLYPCGTTGEMFLLAAEERMRVAEAVIGQAAGRVVVYIHVGAVSQQDTIRLARHAAEIGADGVGAVTPTFFSLDDRMLEAYYTRLANAVPEGFPVYLYNIPQCSANDLRAETVARIAAQCPNVVGIKYSLPDMLRVNEYLRAREGFSVQGYDRLFLASLAMGCMGVVSGISNVYPEPYVKLYEAFERGDLPDARRWQRLCNVFCDILHGGANMAYFKAGMEFRGLRGGHMRAPLLDLTGEERECLLSALREAEEALPAGTLIR